MSELLDRNIIALVFSVNKDTGSARNQKSLLKRNLIQKENSALAFDVIIHLIFNRLYAVRQEEFVVPEIDVAVGSLHFVVFVGGVDGV